MAWDATGWTYHKVLTIDQTDTVNDNYQIKLLVGKSSSATGEQVDCADHCEADFDDLRFSTDAAPASATLLDYWIESISGSGSSALATVWVEVTLPNNANDVTIRMYYGNAGASAATSIKDTFILGDDFEWGSDEDDITTSPNITWSKTVAGTSTAKIDTSQSYSGSKSLRLYIDGTNAPDVQFVQQFGTGYAINWRGKKNETDAVLYMAHGNGTKFLLEVNTQDNYVGLQSDSGTTYVSGGAISVPGDWEQYELNDITNTPSADLWYKGAAGVNNVGGITNDLYHDVIVFVNGPNIHSSSTTLWIDNVFVRKWTANEPTWSSFGGETSTGWANIAKINGVTATNIAKVNGVVVASITKVNGVTV